MIANRYSKIFTGLLILVVASVSVNFVATGVSSKKTSGNAPSISSNTYLPLPPGKQTQLFNAARDARMLYHRSSSASSAAAYPDYFQRHPELSATAASSVDVTDYYFRHLIN